MHTHTHTEKSHTMNDKLSKKSRLPLLSSTKSVRFVLYFSLLSCADEILNTHGVVWNCVYIGQWRDDLQ